MTAPFLVRVDDFPAWIESMDQFVPASDFERFHRVLAKHSIPYMIAVTPQPALRPLDLRDRRTRTLTEQECGILRSIAVEGATLGLHGVTHSTRDPRKHAEFARMDDRAFQERIVYGDLELERQTGTRARVFVPPFNRMSPPQLELLGKRFRVVCGGPESVVTLGRKDPGRLSDNSRYLPSYPPFYGRAYEILRAIDGPPPTDLCCLTLHWEWERRRTYDELDTLCAALRGRVAHWNEIS
jgi:peptidoglycan/xylan/chitin deacetylase (PgdA/CDA1 family)